MQSTVLIFLVIVLLLLSGCNTNKQEAISEQMDQPFFNIKSFLDAEILRVSSIGTFRKITMVNGLTEEKGLDSLDLKSELSLFYDVDINRPAWIGKYSVDSTFNVDKQLTRLHYLAKDEDLGIRSLTIEFQNDAVERLEAIKVSSSALAKSNQKLSYSPATGFIIESTQGIRFTSDNVYKIEVRFE